MHPSAQYKYERVQAPTVPKKILAHCGMLRHAVAQGVPQWKKKTQSVQYALKWRLVGNRWRLVGNR